MYGRDSIRATFLMFAAAMQAASGALAEPPSTSDGTRSKIDEIVVYARKRAELIEETPVSITTFNQEQLQMTGTTRIDEIQTLVPNLTMLRGANGQTASFNMRGVGNFPSIHFDQGVGVYVDGVYLSRNAGTLVDIVDTQSVEVLRGPQGTLFGKNNLGGAINITTVKPSRDFEASIFVRGGSYDQADTRATLNVPLDLGLDVFEDKLFTRLTFASFYNGGYVYNPVRDEHVSDRNSLNFLGSLRYLPTDDLTIDISGTWSKSHTQGLGAKCIYIEPENIDTPFQTTIDSIEQIVTATGAPASDYRDRCNATTPYRTAADEAGFLDLESAGAWGIFQWELGEALFLDDLMLKFTSSWREQTVRGRTDLDQTPFPIFSVGTAAGGPLLTTIAGPRASEVVDIGGAAGPQRQIQQELQVNASAFDDYFKMVGGVFSFWENAESHFGTNALAGTIISNPPVGIGQTRGDVETSNWDWALYGQLTFDPFDWLSLTGGARYTEEKKGLTRTLQQPNSVPPVSDPLPVDTALADKFSDVSPMASISLTAPESWLERSLLDHVMGYYTYSEGFRGGGFNGDARFTTDDLAIPFKPETIESNEFGIKSVLFDRRVTFNVAFFLDDRTDQQVPQFKSEDCPTCVIEPTDILVTNAGQSSTKGFEVETGAQPWRTLLANASVGYLDGEYDDFPDAQNSRTGELINRAGERFSFLPEWQTHVGLQYTFDIADLGPAWTDGSLTPRLDWSWQSRVVNWAPELPELVQPAFHLLNLRSTYSFNEDTTTLAFFIKNVTDEAYFRDSIALGPRLTLVVGKYYEPPRWYGFEISQSF